MIRPIHVALPLTCLTRIAYAQDEAALRAAFEGKSITVKIDVPGTSRGVDVYPQNATPLDVRELANRLKEYGTALKPGQSVMITKVVIKGTTHIEFQLGGGGYGTLGDLMSNSSSVSAPDQGETKAERALRDSIKAAQAAGTPTKRKQLARELASLRSEREPNLRSKRMESGSRFNIRYRGEKPLTALTPDDVRQALAEYVDFPGTTSSASAAPAAPAPAAAPPVAMPAAAPTAGGLAALRKGLSVKDAEALLGPAASAGEQKEGAMIVMKRTYRKDGVLVTAKFVSDVLIDFTISPQ